MRIAKVIGTVTLSHPHPSLSQARLKLAIPLSLENLVGRQPPGPDALVVYDEQGAGVGSQILLSEGREAAQPFFPDVKPIDAYNAGILDKVDVEELSMEG